MPAKRKPATVVSTATFTTWHVDDENRPIEYEVHEGDELPVDHPIVEGHREFFKAKGK
jgi:hypothetical protein